MARALARAARAISRAPLTGAARAVARPSLARPFAAAASPPWLTPGGQLGVDEDEDYMVYPRERPGARASRSTPPGGRGRDAIPAAVPLPGSPPPPTPRRPRLERRRTEPPRRSPRVSPRVVVVVAGKDYALNWSLNRDGVTPAGDAYRFTKAAAATKMLGATPEAAKKAGAAPPDAGGDELSFEAFDAAYAAVVERFEAPGRTLYVADGDAPKTRTQARVVSDDLEAAASAMCHALERMPLRAPQGGLPVTAYVAPSCADYAGAVVEDARLKIVLCGAQATAASVKASLAAAPAMLEAATAPVEEVDEAA